MDLNLSFNSNEQVIGFFALLIFAEMQNLIDREVSSQLLRKQKWPNGAR